jgi:hypothetical protein
MPNFQRQVLEQKLMDLLVHFVLFFCEGKICLSRVSSSSAEIPEYKHFIQSHKRYKGIR